MGNCWTVFQKVIPRWSEQPASNDLQKLTFNGGKRAGEPHSPALFLFSSPGARGRPVYVYGMRCRQRVIYSARGLIPIFGLSMYFGLNFSFASMAFAIALLAGSFAEAIPSDDRPSAQSSSPAPASASTDDAETTTVRSAKTEPMVAPVKRVAPQMPENKAKAAIVTNKPCAASSKQKSSSTATCSDEAKRAGATNAESGKRQKPALKSGRPSATKSEEQKVH